MNIAYVQPCHLCSLLEEVSKMEDHLTGLVIVPQKSQAPRTGAHRRGIAFHGMSQIDVTVGDRSKVDLVAGKTLIDKKS